MNQPPIPKEEEIIRYCRKCRQAQPFVKETYDGAKVNFKEICTVCGKAVIRMPSLTVRDQE